jgi:stalled ribosome rescue protein Dom34
MGETTPATNICPHCQSTTVRPTDLREELVRQAGKMDCPVEVVEYCEALSELGGVGCLLRFRADF